MRGSGSEGDAAPLHVAAFRRFCVARTVSRWGDTFNTVALVVLVYRLTGSGLDVGATVVLEILPVLALGFAAGAFVDRYPRVVVLVIADLARMVVAALLALSHHDLAGIYAATFAMSAATVFFNPAASSILPSLVRANDIAGANSMLWSAAVLSQIVLAPLAGLLVATGGAGPAFAVNAASFLLSAMLLSTLRTASRGPAGEARQPGQLAAGYRAIKSSRLLSTVAVTHVLAALSAGATSALLVVLAERHLHVGATAFGALIGGIGVGAGAGPLLLVRATRDVRRPRWLFGPYLLRGVVDLVLATVDSFSVVLGALVGYGIGTSTGNLAYTTTLQTAVPDAVRGRVFAFYDVIWAAARIASILIGGVLADTLGIVAVYYLGAILMLAAGTVGLLRLRGEPGGEQPDR